MKTLEELIEQFSFDGDGLTLTSDQIAQLLPGLKQAQSEKPRIPEGWALVPLDATEIRFNEHWVLASDYEKQTKELETARAELDEAKNEASTCDDIKLDQSLAGIIHDLQKTRRYLEKEIERLTQALKVQE